VFSYVHWCYLDSIIIKAPCYTSECSVIPCLAVEKHKQPTSLPLDSMNGFIGAVVNHS